MEHKAKEHRGGGWLAFALLFGMLIWVRLRLVTDIPRSAYADPGAGHSRHIDSAPPEARTNPHAVAQTPEIEPQ